MIVASDTSLYTGITTDIHRRFKQHYDGKGARYFHSGRRPQQVVFQEQGHDRSSASQREAEIKRFSRREKIRLADSVSSELAQELKKIGSSRLESKT